MTATSSIPSTSAPCNTDDLQYSTEYGEWLMDRTAVLHDMGYSICNGDALLLVMEKGVLFDQFLQDRACL